MSPDEKDLLWAQLIAARFVCNWAWPLIFLGSSIYDIIALISGDERNLWRWSLMVLWYTLAIGWWSKDVRRLRWLREQWKEVAR